MSSIGTEKMPAPQRVRDWHHAGQAAVCDLIEPWEHGTVVRASRYPTYYSFNLVRVEQEPGISAPGLAAFAGEALAGPEHPRLDFAGTGAAESPRAEAVP